jgi:CDP-2,3-bis-(O-geranylgeranyl)-sn-glycerol synthase
MDYDVVNFVVMCLQAVYLILPAYIANLSGLAFGGGTPVDLGKNFFDGRRIIGDGVTIKGFLIGTVLGTILGIVQGLLIGNFIYGLILGFLLSFGALFGDAIGSFIKRRLNIGRGRPAPILDQLDFLFGALIFASLYISISWTTVLIAAVITFIVHILSNVVAYVFGIKDVWY